MTAVVARRRGRRVTPRATDHLDADLGLASIDRVELLLSVQAALGVSLDGIGTTAPIETFGDLLAACRAAVAGTWPPLPADDPALCASRDRATARRRRLAR